MPNCAGERCSVLSSCGPSGITTMKSTMLVNCTDERMSRMTRSRDEKPANASASVAEVATAPSMLPYSSTDPPES